jgi:hypothetical protein
MINLYDPRDPGRAICARCRKIHGSVFYSRDVTFGEGGGIAEGARAAACDACGDVAAAPARAPSGSPPAPRRAGEIAEISLEINLPAPEIDILDAAAFKIDPQATSRFRKTIFAYYLHRIARDAGELAAVQRELAEWSAACKRRRNRDAATRMPGRRLSFKLTERTQRRLEAVLEKTGWSKTSLMRAVVMQAEKDILENRSEKTILDLREIAEVVNA